MKKALSLVAVAAALAFAASVFINIGGSNVAHVYASRLAGIGGAGISGVQVQNLDLTQTADVIADFYRQAGGAPVQLMRSGVAAGGAALIYLPSEPTLNEGAYAAVMRANRRLGAIASTIWQGAGGAATYSNVTPGNDVIVALAVKSYYETTSLVSIQNTDTASSASVTINLYAQGQSTPVVSTGRTIPAGASVTIDLDREPDMRSVPNGFVGSMRITSSNRIGVQSFVDIANQPRAVYAFEGVPASMAASTLYAPLTRNNFYGTTGISVMNPGTTPVNVTVDYVGSSATASCAGQSFSDGPVTIGAGSSSVIYQGASNLPSGCVASAVIRATGGNVLAIVNDANNNAGTSAAYNAVSLAQAGKTIALPLVRNGQTARLLTTGIQVMNIGSQPASVTLAVKDSASAAVACTACTQTIAPNASYTWYPPTVAGWDTVRGMYGSAMVSSDQPVAVIVNDASEAGAATPQDSQIYNGVRADSDW